MSNLQVLFYLLQKALEFSQISLKLLMECSMASKCAEMLKRLSEFSREVVIFTDFQVALEKPFAASVRL
jgi:hypothetical protein